MPPAPEHRPIVRPDRSYACSGCPVRTSDGDLIAAHCAVAAGTSRLLLTGEASALACVRPKTWTAYQSRRQLGIPRPVEYVGRTPRYSRAAVVRWIHRAEGAK